jgi:hypothetical protein
MAGSPSKACAVVLDGIAGDKPDRDVVFLAEEGSVAVLTTGSPPVNAISASVRLDVVDFLDARNCLSAFRRLGILDLGLPCWRHNESSPGGRNFPSHSVRARTTAPGFHHRYQNDVTVWRRQ